MLREHVRYIPEESPADLAVYWLTHNDPESAARMIYPGRGGVDVIPADIDEFYLAPLREELLRRGVVLVDGQDGCLYADNAACCLYCHEVHGVDAHEVCVGAVPADDLDGDDTGAMCQVGLHALGGPPDFCCEGRRRLFEALHGEKPIRQCPACHGLGARVIGGPVCDACKGCGIDPAGVR